MSATDIRFSLSPLGFCLHNTVLHGHFPRWTHKINPKDLWNLIFAEAIGPAEAKDSAQRFISPPFRTDLHD